jgi:hypothetical protein
VLLDNGGADRTQDWRQLEAAMFAGNLMDDNQLFVAIDFDRKRSAKIDCFMRLLHGPFDVLRIEIAAANDDDVLGAAGDEQLAAVKGAEVAGPQERPAAVGQSTAEGLPKLFRVIPVSLGHRGAADPDLADLPVETGFERLWVNDANILIAERATATDERLRVGRIGWGRYKPMLSEGGAIGIELPRPVDMAAAAHHERRFGQAVAGIVRRFSEPAGGEGCGEVVERPRIDGLGAAERELPTAQVEHGALFSGDLASTQFVGEVRRSADGGASAGDRLKPCDRPLEERRRRQQVGRAADIERRKDAADQSHVVIRRKPEDR